MSTQYCLSKFEYWEERSYVTGFPTGYNAHCSSAQLTHRTLQISYRLSEWFGLMLMFTNIYPDK